MFAATNLHQSMSARLAISILLCLLHFFQEFIAFLFIACLTSFKFCDISVCFYSVYAR